MKKEYVDIKKYWKIIKPIAESKEAGRIWKRDMKKYQVAFRVYGYDLSNDYFDEEWFERSKNPITFEPNSKPSDYDSCDWRYSREGRGRKPAFWDYVVHGKCHWMVNFNLSVAQKAFPKESWRVISSDDHSCVWNGKNLLFDMNFSALVPDVRDHPFHKDFPDDITVYPVGKENEICITDEDVEILDLYYQGKINIDYLQDHFFPMVEA
jgi:hypothetical protein